MEVSASEELRRSLEAVLVGGLHEGEDCLVLLGGEVVHELIIIGIGSSEFIILILSITEKNAQKIRRTRR